MKKIIILIFILPLLIISSCEKKLEIIPPFTAVEELALSSVDGIDAAIRLAYFYQQNSFPTFHIYWSELMSDEYKYRPVTIYPNFQNYYDRKLDIIAEETATTTDLRGVNNIKQREIYSSINAASLVLRATQNDIAKGDIDFAPNKNRIMGECYFLRAAGNFSLLRFFSKPWGSTPDNSHPGIIINKEPVDDRVSQVKARATVAEVYTFIIDDLIQAESLMPDKYINGLHPANYNGRAYKDAARGLLARVYFQQQNYTKAKEVIDRLIGPTIVSADLSVANNLTRHPLASVCDQPFLARGPVEDTQNDENIWVDTAPLTANGHSASWYNSNESLSKTWTTSPTPTLTAAGVNAIASNAFLALANFSASDRRKNLWFATTTTGELMPGKYTKTAQISIPLIRSAEMVLDRAEINWRNNDFQAAVNDLNVTRERAGLSKYTSLDPALLWTEIQTERLRELCFEGDRLWNLKRLQQDIPPGDRVGVSPLPWNGLGTVLKYFFAEVDKNPLLENNY